MDTFTILSNCNDVLFYQFKLNGIICRVTAWTFSSTPKSLGGITTVDDFKTPKVIYILIRLLCLRAYTVE